MTSDMTQHDLATRESYSLVRRPGTSL